MLTHALRCLLPSSLYKVRKTKRSKRSHRDDNNDDGDHSISSDTYSMEIDSADAVDVGIDDDDAAEAAVLVAKLREGYGRRKNVAL